MPRLVNLKRQSNKIPKTNYSTSEHPTREKETPILTKREQGKKIPGEEEKREREGRSISAETEQVKNPTTKRSHNY